MSQKETLLSGAAAAYATRAQQLLAVGARPRQGVRLLLNRHPLFQVYAEALVLRRETGAYRFCEMRGRRAAQNCSESRRRAARRWTTTSRVQRIAPDLATVRFSA